MNMTYLKNIKCYLTVSIIMIMCNFIIVANSIANEYIAEPSSEVTNAYAMEKVELDKTPEMEEYIAKARRKIKGNWYPPANSFEHKATIIITLNKQGKLLDCSMMTPSSDNEFNDSLLKAVRKTKFSPLPSGFEDNTVDIDFTFEMQKRQINNANSEESK